MYSLGVSIPRFQGPAIEYIKDNPASFSNLAFAILSVPYIISHF